MRHLETNAKGVGAGTGQIKQAGSQIDSNRGPKLEATGNARLRHGSTALLPGWYRVCPAGHLQDSEDHARQMHLGQDKRRSSADILPVHS
jgi:hypothetical protein